MALVDGAYISNCLIMSRGLLVHVNGDNNTLFSCQPNIVVNILVRFHRYLVMYQKSVCFVYSHNCIIKHRSMCGTLKQ